MKHPLKMAGSKMNPGAKVMVGVVVMFMATVIGANLYLIARAQSDPSFAVEEDYYRRAVHWDDEQALLARSRELGWRSSLEASHQALTFRLADASGQPISDASVSVETFFSARAKDRIKAAAVPTGEGVYRLDGPFDAAGLWIYRFEVKRGGDVYRTSFEETLP